MGATVWAHGAANQTMDGIAHYTQELYRHAIKNSEYCERVVWGANYAESLSGQPAISLGAYSKSVLLTTFSGLPFRGSTALASQFDLFHATDHHTPKFKGIPVVATLMDAIPLSHPEWVSMGMRPLKNWLWRKSAHWADHIITISEFSKSEVSKHFGIPDSRISVTPLGVDERYFERLAGAKADEVATRYGLPENYFLFVGTFQPRKNLERLVAAHEALPERIRRDFPLILVGRSGWGCSELVAKLANYSTDGPVRWLQSVGDFEKRVMLQRATALVFPSLLEGFGLPVLEGFASQTPVICSNTSSLPEVAAGAALMVDPLSQEALTEAMLAMVESPQLREEWVNKGLVRARRMTWDACAEKTFEVYRHVLGRG